MLNTALIIFVIAALGGLTLAFLHISKKKAPIALAILHGLLAATGLVLLIFEVANAQLGGLPLISAIIFAAAAMGGMILFMTHLWSKPLPRPLIILHGGTAATALVILLVYVLR